MTPVRTTDIPKAGAPRLWLSFIVIIAAFVIGNIVSIYEMRNSQAQVRLITKYAGTNIELVTRLQRDLDRKRLLIEDHILEKQTKDMNRIEAEMAKVDADIAAALPSYEALGDVAGERAVLRQLAAEIGAIKPHIANVVSLSQKNLDVEAEAKAQTVEPLFQNIEEATGALLAINHARANQEVAQVRALQLDAVIFLAVLTVGWTAFAFLTARRATRLITEQELQMRHAMALLEERNRELDAFAGRVAHDLRGPLTTINLASSALAQRGVVEERNSTIFRRAVALMDAMIEDLLTLSRISAQVGATCQTANVAGIIREDLTPIVEAAGGVLNIEAAAATVSCSEGLLRQALWNLGENAVKYRRSGERLRVEILGHVTSKGYEFSVSDNGKGMSSWESSQAWKPFFRGKEAQSTSGTGLGLSIVKRVIEASGGSVHIDSMAGQGTTFTIRLPLAAGEMAA